MEITVQNSKYFKPYDNSDNECCWQVDLVAEDIENILTKEQIAFEPLYDDWGLGISWIEDGLEYSILVTCVDVEQAKYEVLFEAFRKRLLLFSKPVDVTGTRYGFLIEEFKNLSEVR